MNAFDSHSLRIINIRRYVVLGCMNIMQTQMYVQVGTFFTLLIYPVECIYISYILTSDKIDSTIFWKILANVVKLNSL